MVEAFGPDTLVQQNTGLLVSEFDHDIQSLLAHRHPEEVRTSDRRWVVVYKTADDQLTTLQVGDRTRHLLERTREPVRVQDLFAGTAGDEETESGVNLAAVQKLASIGLLREVPAS